MKNCEILPPRTEEQKTNPAEDAQPVLTKAESSETIKASDAVSASQPSETPSTQTEPAKPEDASSLPQVADILTNPPLGVSSAQPEQVATTAPAAGSGQSRPHRSDSLSRQQVEERHLQVVELLTRQLALNDPTSSMHHAPGAAQSVAFAAPASNSRRGSPGPASGRASAPPMWLDGAIGAVVIALASLILRKVM